MTSYTTSKIGIRKFTPYLPYFLNNAVHTLYRMAEKEGDFVHIFLWKGQEIRIPNHPDFYQRILLSNEQGYSRAKSVKAMKPLLGDGLFMSEGDLWKSQRSLLKPAFHGKMIRTYDVVIEEEVRLQLDKWKQKQSFQIVLEEEIQYLTLRIMIRTLFHQKAVTDEKALIQALKDVLFANSIVGQEFDYLQRTVHKYTRVNLPLNAKATQALNWLHQQSTDFIRLAKENPDEAGWFMTLLLEAVTSGEIPLQQVHDEIQNMFLAGFDTTAASVTWTLHELAYESYWQEQVREEALALPPIERSEQIPQLAVAKKTIQEGLRLYPPAWAMYRVAVGADTIGNIEIPNGAYLMLFPYALHRKKEYWEDPEAFKPERFNGQLPHPFAYVPFGHGPRICIGQRIATIQSSWLLSAIIRNFRVLPPKKRKPIFTGGVLLASKKPMAYTLQKI